MAKVYGYAAFGGPEVQAFFDLPVPDPGLGELLVRVQAAGVNPTDWKRRANFRRLPDPDTWPAPMGLEVAGVVEAVGPEADGFAVGDTVFGTPVRNGGFSEYTVLSIDQAAKVPAGVSIEDAATLPVAAATAFDGIVQLAPRSGETVLVTGAGGGVGIAAAQIARLNGARVIGTASEAKRELLESVGALHVTYGPGETERIRSLAPDGVDALYDNVGGDALRAVAPLAKLPIRLISAGDAPVAGEFGGKVLERKRNSEVLRTVGKLVAEGQLRPFVTEVFAFEQIPEALALVEHGQHDREGRRSHQLS